MNNWGEIELEPEEFMIIHEAVATVAKLVAELVAEESHETAEDDESLNISFDSHCVDESQEVLEDAITDKIKVKTEGVDESEQQKFQAASSSHGREIGQEPNDEDSSSLQEQGSGTKFQCKICLNIFGKKKYLTQHIKEVHKVKKQFKCTECGKGFVSKNKLKRHIKGVHEGKKEFKCTECGRFFVSKDKLKRHIKEVHERKKTFKCVVCGRSEEERPETTRENS